MQDNPIPLSPAPARIMNGFPRIAEDERKTKQNATDILRSENKCFSYKQPIYIKKSTPSKRIDIIN
jgi:hypothetical protein